MSGPNQLRGVLQAFRSRFTVLGDDGVPTPGAQNGYVSSSLILCSVSPVYRDGDKFQETNGAGELCVDYEGPDSFLSCDVKLALCTPDPYLMSFVGGTTILTTNAAGWTTSPPGWALPPVGVLSPPKISVELWCRRVNDNGQIDPSFPAQWFVLPWVTKQRLVEGLDFGNNVVKPGFMAKAFENDNWFNGPNNDWPVASDRVLQSMPCTNQRVPAVTAPNYQAVAAT